MFVLFDLDDTLLMTGEREDRFFGEAFRDVLGRELPTTDWEVLGASTDHGILRALGVGDAAIERVADAHEARWRKALAASPPKPRQGATDALLRVEGLGMPTGVATGGFARVARRKLAALGVSAPPLLATSESGSTRTALLRHAMRELGPEGVYVGDGPWDRRAAGEAGLFFVGVGLRFGAAGHTDLATAIEATLALRSGPHGGPGSIYRTTPDMDRDTRSFRTREKRET